MGYFFLIFARISGVLVAAPLFASRNIPNLAKVGLSVMLSYIIAPVVIANGGAVIPNDIIPYVLIIISEFFIGVILGYVTYIVFYGIQMAGAILDVKIGFGMVHIIDPQMGQKIPLIGNFKYILAMIVYLATNCHHLFLSAVYSSFTIAPVAQAASFTGLGLVLAGIVGNIYIIAFKIAFPIVLSLFLTEVALGILSRTMPQLNIFVVGLPARLIVGFFMLIFGIPFYVALLEVLFTGMVSNLYEVLWHFRKP
jgi:flagellar biosynthetic protein FliR